MSEIRTDEPEACGPDRLVLATARAPHQAPTGRAQPRLTRRRGRTTVAATTTEPVQCALTT